MGLGRRLDLCRAYFSHSRDFDCVGKDALQKIFLPTCTMRAKSQILKIEDEDAYKCVRLRKIKDPLYWPQSISLYNLYMVISESLYQNDWHYYEVPETQVKPGDVVLDCGGAEGLFSLAVMARAERIIIIEPSPIFAGSLQKTFHDVGNVRIMPCALSNQTGEGYLSSGSLNSVLSDAPRDMSPNSAFVVKTTTIDRLVCDLRLARVDYIKADLESFELEALKGAVQTIRQHKPRMAFTTYHHGNDWKEMRDFVLSIVPGYSWRVKGLSYLDKSPKPVMIHFWPL